MSGPRVLPEYYGPNGDQIANAFYNQAGRKRQNMLDTRAGKESDARLAESTYRLQHEQQIDPLEDAIRRATAREHGIMGPGEQGATDMQPGGQSGLPPVQMPQQPPPAAGPPTGKVMNPLYDMTPVEGTAAQPGRRQPGRRLSTPRRHDAGRSEGSRCVGVGGGAHPWSHARAGDVPVGPS